MDMEFGPRTPKKPEKGARTATKAESLETGAAARGSRPDVELPSPSGPSDPGERAPGDPCSRADISKPTSISVDFLNAPEKELDMQPAEGGVDEQAPAEANHSTYPAVDWDHHPVMVRLPQNWRSPEGRTWEHVLAHAPYRTGTVLVKCVGDPDAVMTDLEYGAYVDWARDDARRAH